MFSLFNKYPLWELLKKVQRNARAMGVAYAVLIGAGVAGLIFIRNGALEEWWVVLYLAVVLAAMLFIIAPFLLYDYFRHKHQPCSFFLQDSSSLGEWDAKIRESEQVGGRLGISDEYLFSTCSTFYIPCFFPKDHIQAVYSRRSRYRHRGSLRSDTKLYVICRDGALYQLPMGGKLVAQRGGLIISRDTQPLDEWILSKIHAHMPHLRFGILYSHFLTKDPHAIVPLDFDVSEQI